MALERIDPFHKEDRFCLDHLLRYEWAKALVEEKRVLDVACGLGFGTTMLAHANASAVAGVDLDEETIRQCRDWWKHPRVEFKAGKIEELASLSLDPFDRVVCFETLEHVEDPVRALEAIHSVMKEDGVLIGSVPGETDWAEENEFHLQFFNPARLEGIVGKIFKNVRLFRQRFHLSSLIEGFEEFGGAVIHKENPAGTRIDFGRAPAWADTYLFIASDGPLPDMAPAHLAFSRQAWIEYSGGAETANRELKRVYDRYRELFAQHGDLKRRFTNVLGWGRYFHEQATGKEPDLHYLDTIERAKSTRETDLRAELETLQRENDLLRKQLMQSAGADESKSSTKRAAFLESLKSPEPETK
jgi:2-polyprenyl-3-methyl-5-hydroxy-6-metoxy-1,4-benzoquinol methylase